MTHLYQTSVGFRESEPFRFECATCGSYHLGIPSFGWDFPVQYLAVPESERAGRVDLSDDACVIDDQWYFVRGCLEIPVNGYEEPLSYGVWLSLSRIRWIAKPIRPMASASFMSNASKTTYVPEIAGTLSVP